MKEVIIPSFKALLWATHAAIFSFQRAVKAPKHRPIVSDEILRTFFLKVSERIDKLLFPSLYCSLNCVKRLSIVTEGNDAKELIIFKND